MTRENNIFTYAMQMYKFTSCNLDGWKSHGPHEMYK